MRNRGRTAEQWKKLHQLTRKNTPLDESDAQSEQDEQSEETLPARRPKKKQMRPIHVPKWQAGGMAKLLSSDDDDGDTEIIVEVGVEDVSHAKRKRERSRSRSITPPPALSAHQLANAKDLVRQVLAVQPRATSPTLLPDDSTDTIVLDPELARIAEAVQKQRVDSDPVGGPESINIRVKWLSHPLSTPAKTLEWPFQMKRHDTFRALFEAVADLASVMIDQLVVTYDGKRVFPSGSPHSLRIWAEGELEACEKNTHEYIRDRRHRRSHSPFSPDRDMDSVDALVMLQSESDLEVGSVVEDKFKLVLRSAAIKDITLNVRPTTNCGAIVKAFLKAAGLADVYNDDVSRFWKPKSKPYPQLLIDGEKQHAETKIGDTDLEDGDLVDVVGI